MFKVFLGIISVTLVWGYTWVTMKIAISDIPPILFSSLRLLIGAIPLFILLIIQRKRLKAGKENYKNYLIMSLFMALGYMGILTYGMQFVDSGKTSVLVYTMPIFVTIISHFKLNEKVTIYKMVGLIFCLVGLLFILGTEIINFDPKAVFGELLVLISALSWASANVFSKLKFKNIDIIHMNAWQLIMGTIFLFIFSLILEPNHSIEWSNEAVLSLLFNGLFSTAFTFVVWFWVLKKIDASKASMALMFVPILGIIFGWLQLGEIITIGIIIGALLICAGIFMNMYNFKSTTTINKKGDVSCEKCINRLRSKFN
ncbi:DMT family transporter [Bacillus sp. V2I10]|uniref:DMT family transporter n=1 Tax=Bacillus sp. V2I10 TaxID=3042276 RepID=UPI002787887B|nr:DMT family transporter [Bacillus sp. V2I10]MDQ0859638.1 drug/metabolite transporter (DMT)-like permease [Bacillus sp. V2I10]